VNYKNHTALARTEPYLSYNCKLLHGLAAWISSK